MLLAAALPARGQSPAAPIAAPPAAAPIGSFAPAARAGAERTTPHVHAELLAHAPQGVAAGQPLWVGLRLTHQPHWHTYWKNAGDSGLPTELRWTLPPGIEAGPIDWPTPSKIAVGPLINYGYAGTVLLPVPLTVTPAFKAPLVGGSITIKLHASWLVCREECVPEEGDFALTLPVASSTALNASAFDAAHADVPQALAAPSEAQIEGQTLKLRVAGLPAAARGRTLTVFPEIGSVIDDAKDSSQAWHGEVWTATLPLSPQRNQSPGTMPLVLALADSAAARAGAGAGAATDAVSDTASGPSSAPVRAWRTEAAVHGIWPAPAAAPPLPPTLPVTPQASAPGNAPGHAPENANANSGANTPGAGSAARIPAAHATFALALLGALIGGLLLNLMPCVFPVLAIKVLSFTHQADDRHGHHKAALAYSAGVILSCLALGGAMLALRAAGTQLGWGFQLQSPAMVAALAALFTLIGLNLAGVFAFTSIVPPALAGVQTRYPRGNDFLSGVLAVLVASPCSAPYMGASLGWAIVLPAAQALGLFGALGLGLALPYLVAGFVPAVVRLLPRPGAWMETLRRLLAFPMFGTVAWLVWVLGQQSGIDGAGALLALLVALSAIVWALTLRGWTRALMTLALGAITVWMASQIGAYMLHDGAPAGTAQTRANAQARQQTSAPADERWAPWSPARVDALVRAGRPVFVDFSAAWCVTCKFNEKTTLADAQVLAAFDARHVALLRADWTRRDPAISAALAALGRSGVPVYVLHAPGQPPRVLTEILSKNEVLKALAAL